MTQLQAGEMAPDFKSTTQDGEPLTLADLRGQRTILYFYPKDNTSGCTLEAKSLRDGKAELTRMGFRIIGVSPDSEKSHRSFCDKHDLNFTLLSDTDHSVCEAYGVWAEKSMYGRKYMGVLRTTFVIDAEAASRRFSPRWTPRTTTGRSLIPTSKDRIQFVPPMCVRPPYSPPEASFTNPTHPLNPRLGRGPDAARRRNNGSRRSAKFDSSGPKQS